MSAALPRATYQDVLNAPPHKIAQIVRGVLHVHPRPALPHAVAAGALNINIGSPFGFGRGGPGGWWILPEPELHPGEDIVVPDIAGWRKERMPKFPDAAYCTVPPDWACEVLSPSTRKLDTGMKRGVYAREGVRHLWMADPDAGESGASGAATVTPAAVSQGGYVAIEMDGRFQSRCNG